LERIDPVSNPVPPPGGAPQPGDQGQPGYQGAGYQGAGYPPPGPPAGDYPAAAYPQSGPPLGGYPAPGQPQTGDPAQPGYQPGFPPPQGGQPAPGHPAPGYPAPGYSAAGYPAPGQPAPAFGEFPTEKKKGGARNLIIRIGIGLLAVIVAFVLKTTVYGDKARDAKAGDCIAAAKDVSKQETTKTSAKVVDCGSSDAKFSVVARVDGESNENSPACQQYFKEGEEYYVYASTDGKGYLLCLRPKA
jgi:hypothetical protein